MDQISRLNLKTDTTISIINEALFRGIDTWVSQPDKLIYRNGRVTSLCQKITSNQLSTGEIKEIPLEKFNFFFIRQDPPFDMNYISNCYLLEVHKSKTNQPIFINDPSGIKNFTEKIFPLYFNKFMPYTIVTCRIDVFKEMLNRQKSVILKPLYNKGGEGISKINLTDSNKEEIFKAIMKKYKSPVIVQEFLKNVKFGDKRVILIDGLPMGVLNRIPKKGDFKANLHLGGKAEKTQLTKKERKICNSLKKALIKNNLFLVGIDLISEKLTEINVTSPTGITQINELYNENLANKIWDKLFRKYSI